MSAAPAVDALRLLVVDDEPTQREMLQLLLERAGFKVTLAVDGKDALNVLERQSFHLVLSDQRMPGIDGLELLVKARELRPDQPFVLMTAYGSVESAVAAMKRGAADYLTKPFTKDELMLVLERVLRQRRLQAEVEELRNQLSDRSRMSGLIGVSAPMRAVFERIERVASTDASVLVTGESGTGKELVARRLHHSSRRAQGPLVVLNCAALSETLLESNLFGHVKGAFTDAREDRPGAFVQADGGTLFLDEVGEMSPSCQAKLLRVLEYGEVTPVGGSQPRRVSVRLVAATNRDLAREVEEQRFRLDLYYRLRGIEILVPPLRERSDDIPVLAEFFLRRAAESKEKAVSGFAPEVLDLFCRAPWPGNVRELRHTVEAMVTMSNGETLTVDDIPVSMRRSLEASAPPHQSSLPGGDDHADSAERAEIVKVLQRTCYPATGRWNIARAARELGMSRKTLEYKIKKVYALPAP
ncbi:MAG: sigma-54-dependent Fis family transcriptional regulator [Candidatus Sumerlaeia bacterium]|nr:sigma-54-dependent Fis family transcriptional regulator [Candidatus Sumerlaeia bacterium]